MPVGMFVPGGGAGVTGNEDCARARDAPARLKAPINVIRTTDCFNVLLSLRKIRAV